MSKGRFITVEGIEGTGKSTNIEFVRQLVAAHGYPVLTTREPGGSPMAENIRQLLLDHGQEPVPPIAELLLFFAARSLHLENTILPAIAAGTWVICDRFTDATRAYQGHGRGQPLDRIEHLANWVQTGLEPDLTLLLDAPAETGRRRAAERGEMDRLDNEALDFYRRVREAYLALARRHPGRIVVIDAGRPLEEVQADIATHVGRLLGDEALVDDAGVQ